MLLHDEGVAPLNAAGIGNRPGSIRDDLDLAGLTQLNIDIHAGRIRRDGMGPVAVRGPDPYCHRCTAVGNGGQDGPKAAGVPGLRQGVAYDCAGKYPQRLARFALDRLWGRRRYRADLFEDLALQGGQPGDLGKTPRDAHDVRDAQFHRPEHVVREDQVLFVERQFAGQRAAVREHDGTFVCLLLRTSLFLPDFIRTATATQPNIVVILTDGK